MKHIKVGKHIGYMHQKLIKNMLIEKSRDESRPEMKWSLSMVKCLLLFTCICWVDISSLVEVIPVKKTGWEFIPGWKKEKNMCKHFITGWNFTTIMFLLYFRPMYSICFPTLTGLSKIKVTRKMLQGLFETRKMKPEKSYHSFSF